MARPLTQLQGHILSLLAGHAALKVVKIKQVKVSESVSIWLVDGVALIIRTLSVRPPFRMDWRQGPFSVDRMQPNLNWTVLNLTGVSKGKTATVFQRMSHHRIGRDAVVLITHNTSPPGLAVPL